MKQNNFLPRPHQSSARSDPGGVLPCPPCRALGSAIDTPRAAPHGDIAGRLPIWSVALP